LLLSQRENGQTSPVKDHVESEADSSTTSMEVEDSPAGSHDDKSKPISKRRRRLLQKQRVDVPVEQAIRTEITSYLHCQADDKMDKNPPLFWKTNVQFEHLKPVQIEYSQKVLRQ